jgi:hypothetical protein
MVYVYIHYDWYLYYDWYIWLIYTLWLFHLIDTYTIIDTADWCILYDWYPWLMHQWGVSIIMYVSIRVIRCINHSVCINQLYQSYCMYQPGGSIMVYVSIRVDVSPILYAIWLTHLIDTYTMTDTPDWYIHYDWYIWCINQVCQSYCMYQSGVSIIV